MDNPLSSRLLRAAYSQGYFPMPDTETDEILWYRPNPRAIIPLSGFHCSHSLRRTLNRGHFTVSFDKDFASVMRKCADRKDTWINETFHEAYGTLHREGFAHSVEVWEKEQLVGGVYGVSLGGAFFAESKFHTATDASKVALFHLVERLKAQHFQLLEVQFITPHLRRLGAISIPDEDYMKLLEGALKIKASFL